MGFRAGRPWSDESKQAAKGAFRVRSRMLVLSVLRDGAPRTPKSVHDSIRAPHLDVVQVLADLARDGFVEQTANGWAISGDGRAVLL